MMSRSKEYTSPELEEYGSVESITLADKCGTQTDVISQGTSLSGSVVGNGGC